MLFQCDLIYIVVLACMLQLICGVCCMLCMLSVIFGCPANVRTLLWCKFRFAWWLVRVWCRLVYYQEAPKTRTKHYASVVTSSTCLQTAPTGLNYNHGAWHQVQQLRTRDKSLEQFKSFCLDLKLLPSCQAPSSCHLPVVCSV
jgi:hypothetical protein